MADPAVVPTQEELISRMDPDRDYGMLGFDGTVTEVRRGVFVLSVIPGVELPGIRKKSNSMAVKGTVRLSRGNSAAGVKLTRRLIDYMEQDGGEEKMLDIVNETLNPESKYDIPWKSRVDMVMFLTERIAGRPVDARPPVEDALIKQLLSRMQDGTLNEMRPIPELPTSREVELEVE